jgi:hypothetical protein
MPARLNAEDFQITLDEEYAKEKSLDIVLLGKYPDSSTPSFRSTTYVVMTVSQTLKAAIFCKLVLDAILDLQHQVSVPLCTILSSNPQ